MLCIINVPFYIPYIGNIPKYIYLYIYMDMHMLKFLSSSCSIPLLWCTEKLLKTVVYVFLLQFFSSKILSFTSSISLLPLALVKVTNDFHLAKSNDECSVLIILGLSADLYIIDLFLLKTFILLNFSDATLF